MAKGTYDLQIESTTWLCRDFDKATKTIRDLERKPEVIDCAIPSLVVVFDKLARGTQWKAAEEAREEGGEEGNVRQGPAYVVDSTR